MDCVDIIIKVIFINKNFNLVLEQILYPINEIKYDKNPLLYLLCLVDTIDPIKYFKKYDSLTVLNSLDFEFANNRIIINYRSNLFHGKLIPQEKFYNYIEDLSHNLSFLDLDVNQNVIELKLNGNSNYSL